MKYIVAFIAVFGLASGTLVVPQSKPLPRIHADWIRAAVQANKALKPVEDSELLKAILGLIQLLPTNELQLLVFGWLVNDTDFLNVLLYIQSDHHKELDANKFKSQELYDLIEYLEERGVPVIQYADLARSLIGLDPIPPRPSANVHGAVSVNRVESPVAIKLSDIVLKNKGRLQEVLLKLKTRKDAKSCNPQLIAEELELSHLIKEIGDVVAPSIDSIVAYVLEQLNSNQAVQELWERIQSESTKAIIVNFVSHKNWPELKCNLERGNLDIDKVVGVIRDVLGW